jgi:hypothetical protein
VIRLPHLAILLVLCTAGSSRAEDLPPELVARPAMLPHEMIAMTLEGGYDSAHALGIPILSATGVTLVAQRGMTSRLELSLATGFAVHPDAGWSRDGTFALAYRAWQHDSLELAPSLTIPLSARSGADLTSTISEIWEVDGVDIIEFSPSRRHLYAAGQISANLGVFGVSAAGSLALLGRQDGNLFGHCVTTDDAGHAFVCDPRGGRLLVDDDTFDRITE